MAWQESEHVAHRLACVAGLADGIVKRKELDWRFLEFAVRWVLAIQDADPGHMCVNEAKGENGADFFYFEAKGVYEGLLASKG